MNQSGFPPWQRRLLLLASPAVTLLFVVVMLAAMGERQRSTERVDHTWATISLLRQVRTRLVDAETGQRGFIITNDSAYLEPEREAARDVHAALDTLRLAMAPFPDEAAVLAQVHRQVINRLTFLELPIRRRAESFEAARDELIAGRGKQAMDRLRVELQDMESSEHARLAREMVAQRRTGVLLLAVLLTGAVVIMAVSYLTHLRLRIYERALERTNRSLAELNDELRAANTAAEQRRAEAEAANQVKTQFLTSMSHELRTPLNAIAGYVDLLDLNVHGPLTEAQRHCLQRVRLNGKHLLVLINDILDYARVQAGKVKLRSQAVELVPVASESAELLHPLLLDRDITVQLDPALDGAAVQGDPDRIRQVLLNLLTNAAKYGDRGSTIQVSARADAGHVHIRVRDRGPGIPPELQQLIFDPFVRLNRDAGGSIGDGVGLGLAISRNLALAMSGDLAVESTPGEGSTFILTLQRAGPIPAP